MGGASGKMIYLELCRIAICEFCGGKAIILPGAEIPDACIHCRSGSWVYGKESIESIRIRTGMTFATRKMDGRRDRRKQEGAGAKSLKRRERARKQWQSLKPKELDGPRQP